MKALHVTTATEREQQRHHEAQSAISNIYAQHGFQMVDYVVAVWMRCCYFDAERMFHYAMKKFSDVSNSLRHSYMQD